MWPIACKALNAATVITATGIEVEMVSPARKPKYALAAPKRMPKKIPATTDFIVIVVAVVDAVKPPERRDAVVEAMEQIGPGIEREKRQQDRRQIGQV